MSDIWKKDPQLPSTESKDDDEIIELVEEIGEESPRHPLSALERKLLDIGDNRNAADDALADLPDIADLARIDFEEEEDEEKASANGLPAAETGNKAADVSMTVDAARLFRPDGKEDSAPTESHLPPPLDDVEEIAEFDEQFLDAEDLLEGLATPPEDTASGEAEDLELLDVEEDDGDNEIVWFDDLDKPDHEAPPVEPAPEEVKPGAPLLGTESESIQDTSAADVFAAHIESARADADAAARLAAMTGGAAAALHAPVESPPAAPSPAAVDASPPTVPGLAPEEIEAAVERVMARKLGGTIEAIILQAIEKAVSKEIERLKGLLLEDETSERMP